MYLPAEERKSESGKYKMVYKETNKTKQTYPLCWLESREKFLLHTYLTTQNAT